MPLTSIAMFTPLSWFVFDPGYEPGKAGELATVIAV